MKDFSIIAGYLNENGKLKRMPGKKQRKKWDALLQYLASKFEFEVQYNEMQVNDIINAQTEFKDPATLRRLMWGNGLLKRTLDGSAYWRVPIKP